MSVNVGYFRERGEIVLTGDVQDIYNNKYAKNYIRGELTDKLFEDKIIIPTPDDQAYVILKIVTEMLKKYGIAHELMKTSENLVSDFADEEERFSEFSQKALEIRNNVCERKDFSDFIESVSSNMRNRTLRDLQLLSAYHLAFSQNSCNFSVPGAGKTSIVYGAYAYLKNLSDNDKKKVNKILVVGPLSSFAPWEMEYYECFGEKPSVKRLVGSNKQDKIDYLYSNNTAELTLISYESIIGLKEEVSHFLNYKTNKKESRVMVVLDEAHRIKKTDDGKKAMAVLDLATSCRSRVVLTGTPAPNGYEDLYNLFKFIWPNKNIIGFRLNQLRDMSEIPKDPRVEKLITNISPFFIRIKKSDLDLPDPINHPPIVIKMNAVQRKIYDFIEGKYMSSLAEKGKETLNSSFQRQLVAAKTVRLMQAATNPALLNNPLSDFFAEDLDDNIPEKIAAVDDSDILKEIMNYKITEIPSKFIETGNLVKKLISENKKVVIWACFIQTIDELKEYLKTQGIDSEILYGATPVEQDETADSENQEKTREKIIRDFHDKDCGYKVIIANPFAVSESISLHKACHDAIYLERSFNAAHYIQSKDRIHRLGLKKEDEINYYCIVSEDSIDETINERLHIKEQRMIEIMEKMPIPLFDNISDDLGDEDIKALMRDYVRRSKGVRSNRNT